MRILIVDDDPDITLLLSEILTERGHTTQRAHDGAQALRGIARLVPHVVLLDLSLPSIDGFEVARRVRELKGSGGPKLIALTGRCAPGDAQRSKQAGLDAHLTKPLSLKELDRALLEVAQSLRPPPAPADAVPALW